ncbi:MAG: glycyl-radical enzyme activating protein [Chloroflexota bacterium]|nr:glycyl-radical enzyme activating protein [Chloroflexota bacterium]
MTEGIITEIERFSTRDGPGIRTVVFLKGCNLRCFWCHNPETQNPKPELQLFLDRCIAIGDCFRVCPNKAHVLLDGRHVFHRELCVGCGECAKACYADALVLIGERKTVDEVVEEVLRDRAFYESSGGGVTLSGGEPLLQLDFSYEILERCQQEGVHTGIETAAHFPWERVAAILPVTDLVMMDIKLMDSDQHRECTGVGNERILANAKRLGEGSKPLIVRTPIIPGVNDTPDQVAAIAEFVSGLPALLYYELLPYHPMGRDKYESLGREFPTEGMEIPPKEKMEALTEVAAGFGVEARHG